MLWSSARPAAWRGLAGEAAALAASRAARRQPAPDTTTTGGAASSTDPGSATAEGTVTT